MKFFPAIVATAAILANNVVSASPLPVAESVDEASPVFGRAVCRPISKPKGRLFNINGKTQYFACKCLVGKLRLLHVALTFAATNAWWLGHLRENSDVDQALSQMAEVRLTAENPSLDY